MNSRLPHSEQSLVGTAVAMGAPAVSSWSAQEKLLAEGAASPPSAALARMVQSIRNGEDPLGDAFSAIRSPEQRRPRGATYTPAPIVRAMLAWAMRHGQPRRVVDPGTGSGRFLVAAGRVFPSAELVGCELDPLAAILTRGHLAAAGLQGRAEVALGDYREIALPAVAGPTLFIGNPPYVRHHLLEPKWKHWLTRRAAEKGFQASQLGGLHVHFFLATVLHASPGDYGAFITAAEWLDVNYGKLVRELFLADLGGTSLHVVEPTAAPFPDAAATAAITCFKVGARPSSVRIRRVANLSDLGELSGGRQVHRDRLASAARWSQFTRPAQKLPAGYIELGELCRVHRGQVTGANRVWIAGEHSAALPEAVLYPAVTRARELLFAGAVLTDPSRLRRVIDLPADLDTLEPTERPSVERFLRWAKTVGADHGYIARNRRVWWAVGLRHAAPILATYMARRPPAFVRNLAAARHINIAHGLYPRTPLSARFLDALARYLSDGVSISAGRTYAGGLTKFEPREMERLPVPAPDLLLAAAT
jgi:adenine-specific DNA-methyltransferase